MTNSGEMMGLRWPSGQTERRLLLKQRLARMQGSNDPHKIRGFATVSGIVSTRPEMISELDRQLPQLSIITSKSYQVLPNPGNREPVIVETAPGCFGNAVGLKNPGMETGLKELRELLTFHRMRALLNVSLSGSSPEEFAQLAEGFSQIADTLELNFSCPHAEPGYGMSIGVDPEVVFRYMQAIRAVTDLPLLPKLTPNVEHIGAVAQAAMEGGADGLVAINTVGPELYLEPHSGYPILMNAHGGKGGKSGFWVHDIALEKVREIRRQVGDEPLIIGMGGVHNTTTAGAMRAAGADIVGIGSAFAQVYPPQWRDWFDALTPALETPRGGSSTPGTQAEARPSLTGSDPAGVFLTTQRQMEYKPYRIISTTDGPGGLRRISVEGELPYEPGQFAFIWIPGIGEKPFSVALSKPLTFLVRERGPMTHALCALQAGDTLYLRGVYGQGAEIAPVPKAWIVAGGTGLAVAPKLAEALSAAGKQVTTYIALADNAKADTEGSSDSPALFTQELSTAGDYRVVKDEGEIGRAVRLCEEELSAAAATAESALYTIGPFPFMDAAVKRAQNAGIPPEHIYISIETPTRCGVGLCGECACAGRLTCREGTFFSQRELIDRGNTLMECGDDH
ncbi:MAG: dihydroorotate dehydrogenase [Spirochaetaceae bacterium]|nr:dihydroorotate dehydrogenase [Spirochaetaceae bacterium]MCF7939591.1 dihydroorotate dehydrogenase [Spirochaetales bacterium]